MPIYSDPRKQVSWDLITRHSGTRNQPSHLRLSMPISLRATGASLFVKDHKQQYRQPGARPMTTTQFLVTSNARSAHDPLPACTHSIATEYYNVPNRAYHTWQHVLHVHACANKLLTPLFEKPGKPTECETEACVLAIAWHDIFQGPNHEIASAAKLYHEKPDITSALAARLIVEGTTHFTTPDTPLFFKTLGIPVPSSDNLKLLTNIFHDADLMILGEEAKQYDEYARAIVVEALAFGLNTADYLDRRVQFLHRVRTAAMDLTLFITKPAQQLNTTVLENVGRELARLA